MSKHSESYGNLEEIVVIFILVFPNAPGAEGPGTPPQPAGVWKGSIEASDKSGQKWSGPANYPDRLRNVAATPFLFYIYISEISRR